MNKIIDKAIDAFNSKFGVIIMTILTVFLLFITYKKADYINIIYLFFVIVIVVSIALMITFINCMIAGKKEYSPMFNKTFLTLIVSIVTLLVIKTMLIFNLFPIIAITLSVFLFYSTLNQLFMHFKSK